MYHMHVRKLAWDHLSLERAMNSDFFLFNREPTYIINGGLILNVEPSCGHTAHSFAARVVVTLLLT